MKIQEMVDSFLQPRHQEAWKKHIRSNESGSGARQSSLKLNTLDVSQRIMIQSHPFITCTKGSYIAFIVIGYSTALDNEKSEVQNYFKSIQHEK